MKSTKHFFFFLFALLLQKAHCDEIPENSHFVNKCVKITNVDEHNDAVLLGYIWFVICNYHEDTYEITSEDCLTKGYKRNTLRVFAVNANYIIGKDIDDLDLPNDNHAVETNIRLEPYAGFYHDSIPINKIEEYYEILGFTDSSVVIFKWKEVFGFNNGSADSVMTYNNTEDISSLLQSMETDVTETRISASDIKLYPNPVEKHLTAEISNSYKGKVNLQLISSNGKTVYTNEINKLYDVITIEISTQGLAKGVYVLSIRFGEAIETKQIVIK